MVRFFQAVDKQQMTALHLAASHDEVEVCRMLIEKGVNLRCCDEEMGTPLHFACMEGSIKVVKMLFEAGEKLDGWVTISQVPHKLPWSGQEINDDENSTIKLLGM